MAPLDAFLLSCIAFAVLALLLLGIKFILHSCATKPNIEEEVPLKPIQTTSTSSALRNSPTSNVCSSCKRKRTGSVYSIDIQISPEELRAIQAALLRHKDSKVSIDIESTLNDNSSSTDDCSNLLIGVHANIHFSSGYCVNPQEKWVAFYQIRTEHFPWHVNQHDELDDSEFEMKNFFFALMLWYDKIEAAKKFHIYTGSRASTQDNNRLWRKAAKLLEHFWHCERIAVGNDNRFHISPKKDAKSFALKIIPAEDLSEGNFEGFCNFMAQYYDIPLKNFNGSHSRSMGSSGLENAKIEQSYEITKNYQQYIDKVCSVRKKYTEPCPKCTYVDDEAASLS